MRLSIVVPCMDEEESLPNLLRRLSGVAADYGQEAEIILVDDGSTDGTWAAIVNAKSQYPQLRGVKLSGNRGHQIALTAGLEAAKGDRIFMLDADLQDPPEMLDDMMAMMDRGYDVVYGRRKERLGETRFKLLTAHMFYRVLNWMSDVPIPNDTGDFRLVSRRALDAVLAMPERARFIRGMFAWVGYDQIGLEYTRAPRELGKTKYPLRKMIGFAMDAVTSFSTKPLRLATRLSFASLFVAGFMAVYVFYSLIIHQTVAGWASTVLAISAFSGIQLLTLGILGEYVGRLYVETKNRPLYFVDDTDNNDKTQASERVEQNRKDNA